MNWKKSPIFEKKDMKYELFIAPKNLLRFKSQCAPKLYEQGLNDVNVQVTQFSSFWNATSYIIDDSPISRIDKVQLVTLFLLSGGIVEFDGHSFTPVQYDNNFWKYLEEHKLISFEEYESLKSHWGMGGMISFMK